MQHSKTILITNDINEEAIAYAKSLSLNLRVVPMIQTSIRDNELNAIQKIAAGDAAEAWVFTSKNAVQAFLKIKNQLPDYNLKKFYAVGNKTAAHLEKLGIQAEVPEREYAADLVKLIVAQNIQSVLFWCGNLRREVLPDFLKEKNIALKELVVYDTIPQPKKITAPYDAIAFLSSSAVESFFSANKTSENIPLFAIGETTLETLKKHATNKIYIAERPEVSLLLDCIKNIFQHEY
jgi:uroporphyrinogen-III synthase